MLYPAFPHQLQYVGVVSLLPAWRGSEACWQRLHFGGFWDGVRTGCARSTTFLNGKIPNEVHKNLLMAGMEINCSGQSRFTWGLTQQVYVWMEKALSHVNLWLWGDRDSCQGPGKACLEIDFQSVGFFYLGPGCCWVTRCSLTYHCLFLLFVTHAMAFDIV